jgi:hypothetical protein
MTKWLLPLLALSACSPAVDPCGDPFYGTGATDEAWQAMVDADGRAVVDDSKSAAITQTPTEANRTIKWTTPLTAKVLRSPSRGVLATLRSWVISDAYAHLPPITGPVHVLKIRVSGETCPIRVVTTQTEWPVKDEAWPKIKDHSPCAEITSAYLNQNRVSEGPYKQREPTCF